jgi:hypothetical protein
MKVGDLVTSRYWGRGNVGMVIEVKPSRFSSQTKVAVVMLPTGERFEQITAKLEIVNESR